MGGKVLLQRLLNNVLCRGSARTCLSSILGKLKVNLFDYYCIDYLRRLDACIGPRARGNTGCEFRRLRSLTCKATASCSREESLP